MLSSALPLSAEKTLYLCECLALCAQSHPPNGGTLWSQPFSRDTGRLGKWRFTRQRWNSSCSASTEPLASSVPFPPLHTSSHLFLLTCDKKPLPERWGEGEASKAAAALEKHSSRRSLCPARVLSAQAEGQLGDRCTIRGDSSHQLLQSLSSWCWGGKRAQVCGSSQGEQPGEWEGKTPLGDQRREKKNQNDIG